MQRILYSLSFVAAFALGAIAVDIWTDAIGAQPTSGPRMETAQAPDIPVPIPSVPVPNVPAPSAPAPSAPPPAIPDGAISQTPAPPSPEPQPGQDGVAVSVTDDAQQAAPEASEPLQEAQPQLQPAPQQPPARETAADQPAAAPATASLREQIGQMLILGFQGSSPDQKWPQTVARQMADGTISGVMFLRYNLKSPAQGRRLMKHFHSRTAKAKHPAFFLLDQEGGRVQRLADNVGVKRWGRASAFGRGTVAHAKSEYAQMAAVVKDWGFNVNLGPVVDVNVNPANPVIAKLGRSYSADPARVAAFAGAFIDAHHAKGLITSLKHFPGHGSSKKDSHLGFTDISRTWRPETELGPYKDLFAQGYADMVMTGHLFLDRYADADAGRHPATLSKSIITGLLRDQLGFQGVVISDDMEMGAIRKHYGKFDAAIRAIKAGVDLLIISNTAKPQRSLPEQYIDAIAKAAATDAALRQRIGQSYRRILKLKQRLPRPPGAT